MKACIAFRLDVQTSRCGRTSAAFLPSKLLFLKRKRPNGSIQCDRNNRTILSINSGRLAALSQRAAEAGELPKACGRSIPDLAPIGLAKLLICAICDRGLGNAATSVREFSALATDSGAMLIDLLEGWMSGAVSTSGLHSLIAQIFPEPSATVVLNDSRLQFGPERSHDGASRTIVIRGDALRAIVNEFRDVTSVVDRAPIRAANAALDKATMPARAVAAITDRLTAPARAAIEMAKPKMRIQND